MTLFPAHAFRKLFLPSNNYPKGDFMKHIVAIFLLTCFLISINITTAVAEEDCVFCNEDYLCLQENWNDEFFANELQISQLALSGKYPIPGNGSINDLTPSTGTVKLPVLFIDFAEERMNESLLEEFENYYNAEYDDSLKENGPCGQSIRGAYQQLSYGRLNLIMDFLPIYHAEHGSQYYNASISDVYKLMGDTLRHYVAEGILNPKDYDSDGDGIVDGVLVKFHYPYGYGEGHTSANYGDYSGSIGKGIMHGVEGFGKFAATCTYYTTTSTSIWDNTNTEIHEIGHMLGLPDHYPMEGECWLDYQLGEIMTAGCKQYINIYDKLLLGWVDPIVLTNESSLSDIELYAVENYSGGDVPRAVVLIPDPLMFPFTEFYIAEYRNASQLPRNPYDQQMYGNPGVVIWHCNTEVSRNYPLGTPGQYKEETTYIQPVYGSGKVKDEGNWYKSLYDSTDLYTEGKEFSSSSTPDSSFYDGSYTGAYLKVERITPEKAVIRTGFRDPDIVPAPELEVVQSHTAIRAGTTLGLTVTA